MSYAYTTIKVSISDDPSHELNTWGKEGYEAIFCLLSGDDLLIVMQKSIHIVEYGEMTRYRPDPSLAMSDQDKEALRRMLSSGPDLHLMPQQIKDTMDLFERVNRGKEDKPSEDSHPTLLYPPEDSM